MKLIWFLLKLGIIASGITFLIIIGIGILHNLDEIFPKTETTTKDYQKNVQGASEYSRDDDYTTERSYEETGDMDCSDFSSQSEAQDFFESEGGPDDDYHNLDRDGDGSVCETL